jgi:EamA-like transporter family
LGDWLGVLIAIVSSSLGGTAAAVTRYLVSDADPLTLAILRWGIGFLCVLPVALVLHVRWPRRNDWPAVAALGICFFGVFFILYNIAVSYTTAARASLALSIRSPRRPVFTRPRPVADFGCAVQTGYPVAEWPAHPEQVAAFNRNAWPRSTGIPGRNRRNPHSAFTTCFNPASFPIQG